MRADVQAHEPPSPPNQLPWRCQGGSGRAVFRFPDARFPLVTGGSTIPLPPPVGTGTPIECAAIAAWNLRPIVRPSFLQRVGAVRYHVGIDTEAHAIYADQHVKPFESAWNRCWFVLDAISNCWRRGDLGHT